MARFVGVNPDVSISVEGRKRIVDSIGLYGAYVLGKYLKQKPDCTLQEAKERQNVWMTDVNYIKMLV